jgi:hypothetical protein
VFELRFGSPPNPPPAPEPAHLLDYLTILANVIGSIAWPVAIVVVVLVFRKQLVRLVGRVKAVSGPAGIGATFADELEKTREAAEASLTVESAATPPALVEDDPFLSLAKSYPEAAVMNAYKELDGFFDSIESKIGKRVPGMIFMRVLRKKNLIDSDIYRLYDRIRTTRNAAVHSARPITTGEALEYRALLNSLLEALKPIASDIDAIAPNLQQALEEERLRMGGPARRATF